MNIDLRSDTVTKPTQAMREAIAQAEVGDDVMKTDETVIQLEEKIAALFGKEAALFVPSGTMANLLAILTQTKHGDEIYTHEDNHVYYYEAGGYASLAGCSVRFIQSSSEYSVGIFDENAIDKSLRFDDIHFPTPSLLTLENTHNRGGGVCWPVPLMHNVIDHAQRKGLRVHIDGARIWNASIHTGESLKSMCSSADSISCCLSKGLGCPVGSLLVSDRNTIEIARKKRKMLGGGMRQAGLLATAGLHALDHHLDRLVDDHRRASQLAKGIALLNLFDFDPDSVETNLVYARLSDKAQAVGPASTWESRFNDIGVLCFAESESTVRFVTHLDIDDIQIVEAIKRLEHCDIP